MFGQRRLLLWIAGLVPIRGDDPSSVASHYLSEDYFPGMVLLDRLQGSNDAASLRFQAYRGGQRSVGASPVLDGSGWTTVEQAIATIGNSLGFEPPEPMQSPWALFSSQGRRLETLASLREAPVVFFWEIGVWIWPPVRVGFEHFVEGVNDRKAVLRTLSLRPKIFEVQDFLSVNETSEILEIGEAQGLVASKGIMQSADRDAIRTHTSFRTSTQAWLSNKLSPLVAQLDQRVGELTRVPVSHNEPVQLLRYGEGNYYHAHNDWTELELYPDQASIWVGNHFGHQDRLATVFWYLNDVENGGETFFPKSGQPVCFPDSRGGPGTRTCPNAQDPYDMNSCTKGFKIVPRHGTVILWYNYHGSGRGDRNSLHAGCPVGKGLVKWSANKWVRIKPTSAVQPRWMDNHPALKRHGWTGSTGQARQQADPRFQPCLIQFLNQAGTSVDVMWKTANGQFDRLAILDAAGVSRMNSFHGHVFQLRRVTDGFVSNEISCEAPRRNLVLSSSFSLEDLGGDDFEL